MRTLLAAWLAMIASTGVALAQLDPTACNPIQFPCFTVDSNSPVVDPNQPLRSADLLLAPGPVIVRPGPFFNLPDPLDDLDALSFMNVGTPPTAPFLMLFSVDRQTRGIVPPDPNLVACGFPFNVQQQALFGQHSADAFSSLNQFDQFGILPPGPLPSPDPLPNLGAVRPTPRIGSNNNTTFMNQGNAGGIDFAVGPELSPAIPVGGRQSNVNGMAGSAPPPAAPLPRSRSTRNSAHLPPTVIAFSVTRLSPSLPALPGTNSGADIYLVQDPNDPNVPAPGISLYAAPFQYGLQPFDELDAMIIFDDGDFEFNPMQDKILFSLANGSPSLGFFGSIGADILTHDPFGNLQPYTQAFTLGLGVTVDPNDPNTPIFDEITALDFLPCPDRILCLKEQAIGFPCGVCLGDVDGSLTVDLADLAIVLANFGQGVTSREEGDLDGDGIVTLSDLAEVLAHFGVSC